MTAEKRIWELDAARGLCILGMVAVHLVYDLTELYSLLQRNSSPFFLFLMDWGGIAFFLISGICITLGRHHVRRGTAVFGCGILVSAVTRLAGAMPVRFGVLHCLGICMFLWCIFRYCSRSALWILGVSFVVLGLFFQGITVTAPWLYPLGLTASGFRSADFFPLLPFLGFFLLGAAFGKQLYRSRTSLFPRFGANSLSRFLSACGRHSLWIYLLHQPLLLLLIELSLL